MKVVRGDEVERVVLLIVEVRWVEEEDDEGEGDGEGVGEGDGTPLDHPWQLLAVMNRENAWFMRSRRHFWG